jgi:hypothetical protein
VILLGKDSPEASSRVVLDLKIPQDPSLEAVERLTRLIESSGAAESDMEAIPEPELQSRTFEESRSSAG